MSPARKVVPSLWGLLGLVLVLTACHVLDQDNFVCGVRANGTLTRCDGPGEVCLCDDKRCANPVVGSCKSGYRYTFADPSDTDERRCVPEAALQRVVTAGSNRACDSPGEAECGLSELDGTALRCGINQFCFCPEHRCAEPWPSCVEDGGLPARFTSTGQCVGTVDGGLAAVRERPDGFCPGVLLGDLFPDAGTGGGPADAGDGGEPVDAGRDGGTADAGTDGGSGGSP